MPLIGSFERPPEYQVEPRQAWVAFERFLRVRCLARGRALALFQLAECRKSARLELALGNLLRQPAIRATHVPTGGTGLASVVTRHRFAMTSEVTQRQSLEKMTVRIVDVRSSGGPKRLQRTLVFAVRSKSFRPS